MTQKYFAIPEKTLDSRFDVLDGMIGRYTHYVHRVMATFDEPMAVETIAKHTAELADFHGYIRSKITAKIVRDHLRTMRTRRFAEQIDDERWRLTASARSLVSTTAIVPSYPDEVPDGRKYPEGAVVSRLVNAYERSDKARAACIAEHGTSCCVCGFNFADNYGEEARGLIHVHHLKPLSEIGEEYEVDPSKDLCPVCPNCHAVIHLGGGCRSIEDMHTIVRRAVAVRLTK